ncbi:MAG: ammonia channel protein, partial [Acidobacteriaceae bacterium]
MRSCLLKFLLLFVVFSAAGLCFAQTAAPAATVAQLAHLEAQVAQAQSSADNSWMLASAALVLLMTGPGLALFYGGLVRRKNVLSIFMQCIAMMSIITVLWAVLTYSLAFDSGVAFIGGLHHL